MPRTDAKLDLLRQTWLFSGLNRRELATVARAADQISVPTGTVLIKEGDRGREFYLILRGTAAVRRGGRRVTSLGPGRYFGELALLDRGPRSATVVAENDMELLVLEQRAFGGVLQEIPGLALKLLVATAQRLREADTKALH
jgi:CRP-like cAMP-binding protein